MRASLGEIVSSNNISLMSSDLLDVVVFVADTSTDNQKVYCHVSTIYFNFFM